MSRAPMVGAVTLLAVTSWSVTPWAVAIWSLGQGGPALGRERAAVACQDYSFPVYFRRASPALAPGAEAVIVEAVRQFKRCPIAAVTVVGLSSPHGGDLLMERRLRAVVAVLRAKGLRHPAPNIAGAVVAHRRPLVSDQAMVAITMAR